MININDFEKSFIIDLEKAKKGAEIGTIKEFNVGGKPTKYIKTSNGWRPFSKKKAAGGEKEEIKETVKESVTVDKKDGDYELTLKKFAKLASESQLKGAINDPAVDSALRKVAQQELENREKDNGKNDDDPYKSTLKELIKNVSESKLKEIINNPQSEKTLRKVAQQELENREKDKKDSESKEKNKEIKDNEIVNSGFKKITQTYVKVNGNTIVLNMKGEDKYKAKKGSFYMESEPNESLVDFKKKVKEAAEKHFNKKKNNEDNKIDKKNDSTIPNFKSDKEYVQWSREKNILNSEIFGKKNYEKLKSSVEQLSDSEINESVKLKSLRHEILDYKKEGFKLGVDFYNEKDFETKLQIQSLMIKEGLLPFVDETTVNSKHYKCFIDKSLDETKSFYKEESNEIKQNMTDKEKDALSFYVGSGYSDIREYNYSSDKKSAPEYIKEIDKDLFNLIDKNPLKENLVLYRRMFDYEMIKRNLSLYHNAKIGDIIQDISFQSFAIEPQSDFGDDFQITLLAKKGDKVMNARNFMEREYIVQKETKFKVIAKGFNSMVVEIV